MKFIYLVSHPDYEDMEIAAERVIDAVKIAAKKLGLDWVDFARQAKVRTLGKAKGRAK